MMLINTTVTRIIKNLYYIYEFQYLKVKYRILYFVFIVNKEMLKVFKRKCIFKKISRYVKIRVGLAT